MKNHLAHYPEYPERRVEAGSLLRIIAMSVFLLAWVAYQMLVNELQTQPYELRLAVAGSMELLGWSIVVGSLFTLLRASLAKMTTIIGAYRITAKAYPLS